MEWLVILAAGAAVIWWSSRKTGMEGRAWRAVLRLFPRPTLDGSLLPRALAVGVGFGVVGLGLHVAGYDTLVLALGLVVGPFAGGLFVRSRWWILVAVATGVPLAASDELRPALVVLPVALVAYVGTRVAGGGRPAQQRSAHPSSDAGPSRS
jgi:hypothetical protein